MVQAVARVSLQHVLNVDASVESIHWMSFCLTKRLDAWANHKVPKERLRPGHSSTIMCVTLCSWGSFSKRRRSTPSQMETEWNTWNIETGFFWKYSRDKARSWTLLPMYGGNNLQGPYTILSHQRRHVRACPSFPATFEISVEIFTEETCCSWSQSK